jgi:hypothetical protein
VGISKSKKTGSNGRFFSCEIRPFHFSAKGMIVVCDSDPKPVTKGPDNENPIILSARARVAGLIARLPLIAKA